MRPIRLLGCLIAVALALSAATHRTRNVILVTADGLRWQEVFTGIDPQLMNEKKAGMADAAELRQRLWRDSPTARREALMPFFWKQLVPHGVAWSNVHVTNAYRVSYPGYSEILTGRADNQRIRGNDKIQNPNETVLEFLRRKLGLTQAQVALIGTWDVFHFIGESRPGSITINAGYRPIHGSPRLDELSRTQFDVDHGHDVAGADRIWLAVRGPDTEARKEMPESGKIAQRDIAPTILELLGINYHEYAGVLGTPIRAVLPQQRAGR